MYAAYHLLPTELLTVLSQPRYHLDCCRIAFLAAWSLGILLLHLVMAHSGHSVLGFVSKASAADNVPTDVQRGRVQSIRLGSGVEQVMWNSL